MANWLFTKRIIPGYENGGSFIGAPFKLLLHTTESTPGSIEAIVKYYEKSGGIPTVTADPALRIALQHYPLDKSCRALRNLRGGVETNNANCVQIEIVGRAAQSQDWPDEWLQWLALEVIGPIVKELNIPLEALRFYGAGEGIVLASVGSPVRLSGQEWLAFNGILGHQHATENNHWDPGHLNIDRIIEIIREGGDYVPTPRIYAGRLLMVKDPYLRGADVRALQSFLADRGILRARDVDGVFGNDTKAGVVKWQEALGIDADGLWGPGTESATDRWRAEQAPTAPVPAPTPATPKPDELAVVRAKVAELEGKLAKTTANLHDTARKLWDAQADDKTDDALADKLRDKVATAAVTIDELNDQIETARDASALLRGKLSTAEREAQEALEQAEATTHVIAEMDDELVELRDYIDDVEAEKVEALRMSKLWRNLFISALRKLWKR